ncbi:MAG: fused response regulator/phosphatase, partial [Pseudomonadota bacterium]
MGIKNHSRRLALVVDDERSNRIMLGSLLRRLEFDLIEASNGLEAVELFKTRQPDIIFMDVMMPELDGYEATRQIKALAGDEFVPVMFLSALNDEQSLVLGIEAGGDDFLTKPYNKTVLSYKIRAMERIHDLQRKTRQMFAQIQRDHEIAEAVFSGAVLNGNLDLPELRTLLRPATLFSGDVVLTASTPMGNINILLGDFTGHGLAAALGALPVSEVFRAMSAKGFSLNQTIATINHKLCYLLPVGMFFAGIFVQICHDSNIVNVFNFGMPDAALRDGQTGALRLLIPSTSFPLGITEDLKVESSIQRIRAQPGDCLILTTDGTIDARNPSGEFFGYPRLQETILGCPIGGNITAAIGQALEHFCQDAPQDDDISLVEIPLTVISLTSSNSLLSVPAPKEGVPIIKTLVHDGMDISLTLFAYHLRQGVDP